MLERDRIISWLLQRCDELNEAIKKLQIENAELQRDLNNADEKSISKVG